MRQTEIIAELIHDRDPSWKIDPVVVTTSGDRDRRPFTQIGSQGLFVAEVERAVVEGRADCAVHSAKDLTSTLGEGCRLVFPTRGPVHDVVIGGQGSGHEILNDLPAGASVGTSSMRRRALLQETRPDVEVVELRGNLDTRLEKVARGDCDAAILAAAGLQRLGANTSGALDPSWWVPPPGQGALAIEFATAPSEVEDLLQALDDPSVHARVDCERSFASALEGGCSVPLGCLATLEGETLIATGYIGSTTGDGSVRDRVSGSAREARTLGRELAEAMLAAGGAELLQAAADEPEPEMSPP